MWEKRSYCPGCAFDPDNWHECRAAAQAYAMKYKPSVYSHMIKCPDCVPVIDSLMMREFDIATIWPEFSFRLFNEGLVYARTKRQKRAIVYDIDHLDPVEWDRSAAGNGKRNIPRNGEPATLPNPYLKYHPTI